jgi:hypothetical protein
MFIRHSSALFRTMQIRSRKGILTNWMIIMIPVEKINGQISGWEGKTLEISYSY